MKASILVLVNVENSRFGLRFGRPISMIASRQNPIYILQQIMFTNIETFVLVSDVPLISSIQMGVDTGRLRF